MQIRFAHRMATAQRSFVREILKVTEKPEIISFAGGLPNPKLFPVKEIAETAAKVLAINGTSALQYSTTEGYQPLREYIGDRYKKKKNLAIDPDHIMITNGSQQGLDLIAKVLLDKGDTAILERPGYLGAIQAFSLYEPNFVQVDLQEDGIDTAELVDQVKLTAPKVFYTVPSFQNPSGLTYARHKRAAVAQIFEKLDTVIIEDDPYGELRFKGEDQLPIRSFMKDTAHSVMMGTFSKIVAPGMRLGWVVAAPEVMDRLIIAKQAADLHTNFLSQRIVHQHLVDHDLDTYIAGILPVYRKQCELMIEMIEQYFPEDVQFTRPEGGMFIWATLPEGCSAMELLQLALKENVAFVPGDAFYTDHTGGNTMRLNFSNSDEAKIEEGIRRLGLVIRHYLSEKGK